jgi:hypothetical protein
MRRHVGREARGAETRDLPMPAAPPQDLRARDTWQGVEREHAKARVEAQTWGHSESGRKIDMRPMESLDFGRSDEFEVYERAITAHLDHSPTARAIRPEPRAHSIMRHPKIAHQLGRCAGVER